ncbi:hypothetical protein GCM10009798_25930 [Nocardioides panacihumi]|uniref:Gfo/Idh/MocA-like oxidoreductase N-terminal domain-containing protein n=1 Tax=Nocardioides panacihumi TaxID=400774 RepID=A0ABN2R738_9ACTN
MSRHETPARKGVAQRRVAILGPQHPNVLALVQESGETIAHDFREAEIVHLTVHESETADALADALGTARVVVMHQLPTSLEVADLDDLAAQAEAAGTVVAVPFVHRYYPMVRLARRRVRSATPGPLHMLHGWATPDAVSAWCDLLEFITSHRVQRLVTTTVAATSVHSADGRADTPGALGMLFETDRGAAGTLAVSQTRPVEGGTLLLALDGVEESIVFHEGRPEVLDVMGLRATQRFQRGVGADVSRYSTQPAGYPQGYRDCWTSFVADAHSAADGRAPDGLPTLADLVRAARLAAAIRESVQSATWAEVDPDSELDPLNITEGKTA